MDDLISRQALLETPWVLPDTMTRKQALECFRNILSEAPAVDAVPVVRCKDCIYFKFGDYCYHDGPMEHSHARENDFCSYGERRGAYTDEYDEKD